MASQTHEPALPPPGQRVVRGWPVRHYGRVPRFDPQRWDLRVCGATGRGRRFDWADWQALPRQTVDGDLHCVTGFSVLANAWTGVAGATLLAAVPPDKRASHVMVWAEFGYGANLPLDDLARPGVIFASARNGVPLSPEHGWPVRLVVPHRYAWKGPKWVRALEYLSADRPGFWEERGYHPGADPWREQRYRHRD